MAQGDTAHTLLALLGLVATPAVAASVALVLAGWLAGPNVSDLGVRMYANGAAAFLGGLAVYLTLAVGGIWLVWRLLQPGPGLLWGVGGGVALIVGLGLTILLRFSYG